jgi:hypothetical protein
VKLCFGAFIKVLRICAKPHVYDKTLCPAVIRTVDPSYADTLANNRGAVSRLFSCNGNLTVSQDKVEHADINLIADGMAREVIPLLDEDKIPLAILALQDMVQSSVDSDNVPIGKLKKSEIVNARLVRTADFFANIFLYTATAVRNDEGLATIGDVNEDYVLGFSSRKNEIQINSEDIIENQELECTLEDPSFDDVFKRIDDNSSLRLKNQSGLNFYYLDISDSAFDYMPLNEFLFDSAGVYVYSRTQIQEFKEKKHESIVVAKALRQMQQNGLPDERGSGNELGEMLVYSFLEGGLHAPKLLSKVEISTSSRYFNSQSDSVHLLKRKVNGKVSYQLVFGASSICGDLMEAIDHAFEILLVIKSGKFRERGMVNNTLMNHTFDEETTKVLKKILVPDGRKEDGPDMAFGIFIGYTLGITADNNDEFRTESVKKMKADIRSVIPYIRRKISELNLGMHSYYFYFLPFNDAENDKKEIMNELLLGGARING